MMRYGLVCALVGLALAGCGDNDGGGRPGEDGNNAPNNDAPNNDAPNNDGNNAPNNDTPGNQAPVLTRIGDRQLRPGRALTINLEATDPDGDALFFSIFGDLPEGAKFDKEVHRFTWTPRQEQLGELAFLTFAVTDGELDDRETVTLTVVEGGDNAAPVLRDPGDQIVPVDRPFELRLEATDPDGDPLAYTIDGPSPNGSALDPATGVFRWTPTQDDAGGNFRVLFAVSDPQGQRDEAVVKLLVGELELTVDPIPTQQVRLGETLRFPLPIRNPGAVPIQCRTLGAQLPGTTFDDQGCVFSWTPTDRALINTTTDFAFEVAFEDNGEEARLLVEVPVTVLRPAADVVTCQPDAHEPNDEAAQAVLIEGDRFEARGLTMCREDVDFFAVELEAGQSLRVDLTFRHADGDIDLAIFREGRSTPVALSTSVDDNEAAALSEVAVGGIYLIQVISFGDEEGSYDIAVSREAGPQCANDDEEPNDTPEEATSVTPPMTAFNVICPGDRDFYRVPMARGDMLRATIVFDPEADLDLTVIGPNGDVWTSAGLGELEEILVPAVPASGDYLVRVLGFGQDTSQYGIELVTARQAAQCFDDLLEPNDDPFDATLILPDEEFFGGLTLCGDADWFAFLLEPGDELLAAVGFADGVGQARFRALDEDATTLLDGGFLEGDSLSIEVGGFDESRLVFLVVDSDTGLDYDMDLLYIPAE